MINRLPADVIADRMQTINREVGKIAARLREERLLKQWVKRFTLLLSDIFIFVGNYRWTFGGNYSGFQHLHSWWFTYTFNTNFSSSLGFHIILNQNEINTQNMTIQPMQKSFFSKFTLLFVLIIRNNHFRSCENLSVILNGACDHWCLFHLCY